MFTYRFRMNFEDQEGFSRDIELLTDQTFKDFHEVISDNLSLDKSVECAFFMCDHRYRKKKQIFQNRPPGYAEQENNEAEEKKLYMEDCILSDYIDDPHQKFLYVYDLTKEWTFFIELARIRPAADKQSYPAIVGSVGKTPQEISRKPIPLPGINNEDELIDDDEDMDTDNEMTMIEGEEGNSYDDEDLNDLDDTGFYDDSIEIGGSFDEDKN